MEEPEVSTQEWQHAHRADSDFESIIIFLKEGTLPADSKSAKKLVLMAQQFSLIDGALYHVQTDGCLMVAVPESLRYYFLDYLLAYNCGHQSIHQHHVNVCHRGSMKMLYYLLACNCAINRYDSVSPVNDTDSSLSLSSTQAMCIGREDYMYNFGTPRSMHTLGSTLE